MPRKFFGHFGITCASLLFLAAGHAHAQTHNIKTVFIILMENHNWTGAGGIKGNPSAPYINNTLLPMASHAESYFNPPHIHPSLPNYLWLEAGTNFGILNDLPPSYNHQATTFHLVTQLQTAGISWKAYLEDVNGNSCPLQDAGAIDQNGHHLYAVRHEPFAFFDDVTDNLDPHSANCIAHLRPYRELPNDLKNGTATAYNWITPNLCDDMHDSCGGDAVAHGDTWLSTHVPVILRSDAYKSGGALFITWDEGKGGDGPIGMIVLSPFAKGGGYSNAIPYSHGSTLRSLQEIFGVRPFIRDARTETDLSDLFTSFP